MRGAEFRELLSDFVTISHNIAKENLSEHIGHNITINVKESFKPYNIEGTFFKSNLSLSNISKLKEDDVRNKISMILQL